MDTLQVMVRLLARACLRLTKGAFQKPPAVDFSFADLSQENMDIGKPVTSEKPVLFLESIYTFGLNDIEKEEVMKLAVSLTTQKAAELGVVAVLARRYLGCYERDEYVLAPFYVYISKSKTDGSIWTLWVERHIPQQKRSM